MQAWLVGGGAMLGYTELFFREKLKIPVQFYQPFRRLGLASPRDSQFLSRNFSGWAASTGTALQALPDSPVRINVLGAASRQHEQKARDFPAMVMVALAGISLLLLPGVHGLWQSLKVGQKLAGETSLVEEANAALQKLETENKKFQAAVQQAEEACRLQKERLRWPQLLEELRRHSQKRVWLTSLQVLPVSEASEGGATSGTPADAPIVEIGGMFETQSEKADAEAVADFQKALEAGGVLRKVEILEREAPLYVDGKTDQVALKFRLRAEWPWKSEPKAPGQGGGG